MSQDAVDDVETGRLQECNSNTSISIPISPLLQSQNQPLQSQTHFSAATGLIATYLIEIGVQIFLIVHCCGSFVLLTSGWDWPWFLTISSMVSSLLVTIVSIVWVCRGLDFAGRLCGRLLCYVMHSLLLGLLWRYLKLAFAYDRADLQEFVALRIFQTYIQSLPLTSIHLAWLINSRENWSGLTLWMVGAEILSVTTALTISSYLRTSQMQMQQQKEGKSSHIFLDQLGRSKPLTAIWFQVMRIELNVVGRVMLLCCRLIVMGIFIIHLKYWTSLVILVHFMVCFTWISFSEKMYESYDSKNKDTELNVAGEVKLAGGVDFVSRVTQCTYVLYWDVSSTLLGGINLWTWALPVLLVLVENVAMIMFHWYHQEEFFVTITSGTCLLVGWLLFSSLNLINTDCCSLHPIKTKRKDKNQQTQSLPVVDPCGKNESEGSHKVNHDVHDEKSIERFGSNNLVKAKHQKSCSWDLTMPKPFIVANNYTNISEVLMTKVKTDMGDSGKRRKNLMKGMSGPPEVLVHRASPPSAPEAHIPPLLQSPLVPPTTWVPDTCCNDSNCNDSNGSSNSRNTNTLLETGNNPPDNDMDTDNPNCMFYYPSKTDLNSVTPIGVRKLSHRSASGSLTHSRDNRVKTSSNRNSRRNKLSPASSCTSFNSLQRIRTSTPVEIKKASRVIVNYPKHHKVTDSKTVSRCYCQVGRGSPGEIGNDLYDKLMEDSYRILICEGEPSSGRRACENKNEGLPQPAVLSSIFHASKKLRVLCAKCLRNHDPLLTNCLEENKVSVHMENQSRNSLAHPFYRTIIHHPSSCRVPPIPSIVPLMPNSPPIASDTTDYPSETEMTWTVHGDDQASMSSHLSTATYTTWPHQSHPNLSMWTTSTMMPQSRFPKEFTSLEYVRTWLLTSQARHRHHNYEKNRSVKKVHRSKTMMSSQSRRVRLAVSAAGGGVSSSSKDVVGSRSHRNLGKRQGPVGRGQSPQSHEALSITPLFKPPPRQKLHPVLPHSVISHHVEIRAHADCHHNGTANEISKVFYKDLEIIV